MALAKYTVTADAVNITTSDIDPQTKRPVIARVLRGETFPAPEDNPSVQTLLAMKSIVPAEEYTGRQRATARVIMLAFKDASTAELVAAVNPIDAPQHEVEAATVGS